MSSYRMADFQARDSIGIPRFTVQQAKAMVDMVKSTGRLNSEPPPCEGQGIVIAGGGRYLSHAWVVCNIIREKGCMLPIQIWHLGAKEMPNWVKPHFAKLGAETVDAFEVMKKFPSNKMSGWHLKNYAIRHSPWRQVFFLDADAAPSGNLEDLMNDPEVKASGGLFFSDVANHCKTGWGYAYCGLSPSAKEWEAGQKVVDKVTGWMGLQWAIWLAEHSDVWFTLGHGDKFTDELGFRKSGVPIIVSTECEWAGYGISQRWKGKEWVRHCMASKRTEHPWPEDFQRRFWEFDSLALGKV